MMAARDNKAGRGRRRRWWVAGGAAACLLLLTMMIQMQQSAAEPAALPDRHRLTASGRIDAAGEARYLAAEIDARIERTFVRPGDQVAAGQPLLALACADMAADLAAMRAGAAAAAAQSRLVLAGPRPEALAQAEAMAAAAASRASDAHLQWQRSLALRASGFVSELRLSALEADALARKAEHEAAAMAARTLHNGARHDERRAALAAAQGAQANVAALAARLGKCQLRSPVAGTVLKLLRREGEFSGGSSGTPLVVVGDLSRLIVRAEIADRDAALVRTGMVAEIWVDGQPQRWTGKVIETSALMGRKTARSLDPSDRFDRDIREVLVAFDRPPPDMPVGLRVNIGLLP
jgi:HlyD family secretion protein